MHPTIALDEFEDEWPWPTFDLLFQVAMQNLVSPITSDFLHQFTHSLNLGWVPIWMALTYIWPTVPNRKKMEIVPVPTSQIALLWWANGGPTVRILMGQRWQPPVAHCGRVQRASVGPPVASHQWASVGPPLGQRWLATGGPLLAHRWLATVGPTVHQR